MNIYVYTYSFLNEDLFLFFSILYLCVTEEMDTETSFITHEKFISSSHAKDSLYKMKDLLMTQKLTDVTLIVSGMEITAHRLVLSSASDYFRAMFTNDLLEANMATVSMEDTDAEALKALVDFCYSGKNLICMKKHIMI